MKSNDSVHSQIEHDHEQLHVTLHKIGALLEQPIEAAAFRDWKLMMLRQLRDFQNDLQKHFDLEEESTYKEEILRAAPQFAGQIDKLEIEHEKVIADLNAILALLKSVQSADSSIVGEIRTQTRGVFALLEAHEAEERTLIQDVYYQDYGTGD